MLIVCIIFVVNHELFNILQKKDLCAHPTLEIYREGQIQFMVPLARQGDFYVPEIRKVERRLSEQEESHSDTDISGTCTSCCHLLSCISTYVLIYLQVNLVGFKSHRTTGLVIVLL